MRYTFKTLYMHVSFVALSAYFASLPHEAYAAIATCCSSCNYPGTINCSSLSSNTLYKAGESVACGCATGYSGTITYTCTVGEYGGYEGQGVYEGYWQPAGTCLKEECTEGQTQSCTTTAVATGKQTCTDRKIWGRCIPTSCKSGYVMIPGNSGPHCFATCTIANGVGYEYVADPTDPDPTDPEESSSSSTTA